MDNTYKLLSEALSKDDWKHIGYGALGGGVGGGYLGHKYSQYSGEHYDSLANASSPVNTPEFIKKRNANFGAGKSLKGGIAGALVGGGGVALYKYLKNKKEQNKNSNPENETQQESTFNV